MLGSKCRRGDPWLRFKSILEDLSRHFSLFFEIIDPGPVALSVLLCLGDIFNINIREDNSNIVCGLK